MLSFLWSAATKYAINNVMPVGSSRVLSYLGELLWSTNEHSDSACRVIDLYPEQETSMAGVLVELHPL